MDMNKLNYGKRDEIHFFIANKCFKKGGVKFRASSAREDYDSNRIRNINVFVTALAV